MTRVRETDKRCGEQAGLPRPFLRQKIDLPSSLDPANQHLPSTRSVLSIGTRYYQLYAALKSAAMASIKQSFQKALDSTALATARLIRRPPINPKTPIQGVPRQPSSNAYKHHQEKEGLSIQKALNSLTHGQNIFVYHNLHTKQVVYSLTRYLKVSTFCLESSQTSLGYVPESYAKRYYRPIGITQFSNPPLRKQTSSNNASTMAKRPSLPIIVRTCGFLTIPCTSTTRKSD